MLRIGILGLTLFALTGCVTPKKDCGPSDSVVFDSCGDAEEPAVADGKVNPYGDLSGAYVN
jgi:hypothetical protein